MNINVILLPSLDEREYVKIRIVKNDARYTSLKDIYAADHNHQCSNQ